MSEARAVVYPTNTETGIEEGVFEALNSTLTSNVMFLVRDIPAKISGSGADELDQHGPDHDCTLAKFPFNSLMSEQHLHELAAASILHTIHLVLSLHFALFCNIT
jgi:hypothetical protein